MHGGRVYEYAGQSGVERRQILDFSANINPLGPPRKLMEAVQAAMADVQHYPDRRQSTAKRAISVRFSVPESWIVCGNGATEVLELWLRHIRPKRLFVLEPAFSEYEAAARRLQLAVEHVRLNRQGTGHELPLHELDGALSQGDLVILNNPHNPSGAVWPRRIWQALVETWTTNGTWVMVDESFLDFLPDGERESAMALAQTHSRLVVIRSATKMFSIPGLRFGFGIGDLRHVAAIEAERDGWSVNQLAQAAAAAAYSDAEFLDETHAWLEREQAFIQKAWRNLPHVRAWPTATNFFLAEFDSARRVEGLEKRLAGEGVYVRSCADFRTLGANFWRVAIRTRPENQRLADLVVSALNGGDEIVG